MLRERSASFAGRKRSWFGLPNAGATVVGGLDGLVGRRIIATVPVKRDGLSVYDGVFRDGLTIFHVHTRSRCCGWRGRVVTRPITPRLVACDCDRKAWSTVCRVSRRRAIISRKSGRCIGVCICKYNRSNLRIGISTWEHSGREPWGRITFISEWRFREAWPITSMSRPLVTSTGLRNRIRTTISRSCRSQSPSTRVWDSNFWSCDFHIGRRGCPCRYR